MRCRRVLRLLAVAVADADTMQHMTASNPGLPGNIGAPATRALTAAGYTELRQLSQVPAAELKMLHGVGPRALKLLQDALEQQGLSLGKLSLRRLQVTVCATALTPCGNTVPLRRTGGSVLPVLGGGGRRRLAGMLWERRGG